ncbi:MAG: TIGR04283 family arsenosugar biosynthesis glycosyltransferase [Pontibacterium sp.]
MKQSRLAIVVPVLNEAQTLPDLLNALSHWQQQGCEIVLVDGGSTDYSVELIQAAGFKVVSSASGRARQMNTGAQHTKADLLLFLHADTRLPDNADAIVVRALNNTEQGWGRFDVCITGKAPMLLVIARMINLRSRLTGIATGDQALFFTRTLFERVGGFPDQALMEDIEISARLKKIVQPVCLPDKVKTSGRRWESRGIWKTIFLMWRLRWQYWRGVSAEKIAESYR